MALSCHFGGHHTVVFNTLHYQTKPLNFDTLMPIYISIFKTSLFLLKYILLKKYNVYFIQKLKTNNYIYEIYRNVTSTPTHPYVENNYFQQKII